jgi:hypothetical protein
MTPADKIALIAAIAAGISAAITLAALFIAWCARNDSKRSADAAQRANELMARQIELVSAEHLRSIQKEISKSRPSFVWHGGSGRSGIFLEYTREFQNVGSEIRDVEIESELNDVSLTMTSTTFLSQNGQGVVTFKSKSSQKLVPFIFSITGTTKLGDRCKELFQAIPERKEIKISRLEPQTK